MNTKNEKSLDKCSLHPHLNCPIDCATGVVFITKGRRLEWEGGFIQVCPDKDGLPMLHVEITNPPYSGYMSHKTLFRIMTDIAMSKLLEKKVSDEH